MRPWGGPRLQAKLFSVRERESFCVLHAVRYVQCPEYIPIAEMPPLRPPFRPWAEPSQKGGRGVQQTPQEPTFAEHPVCSEKPDRDGQKLRRKTGSLAAAAA